MPSPSAAPDHATPTYAVRRAPRLGVFFVLGAVLGALVGVGLALLLHAGDTPPLDPVTGYPIALSSTLSMTVITSMVAGLLLGAVAWLIMDRVSRRRARTYTLEATDDPAEATVGLHRGEIAQYTQRWAPASRPAVGPTSSPAADSGKDSTP